MITTDDMIGGGIQDLREFLDFFCSLPHGFFGRRAHRIFCQGFLRSTEALKPDLSL